MKFSSTKSRTVAVLASLGLALTGFSTSALGAQNEIPSADRMVVKSDSWDPRNLPGDDPKRWLFGMTFQGGQNPMTPSPMIVDDLGKRFCENLSDSCGESERLRLRGYAPECQGRELVSVCVNTLELKLENGNWVRGRILRTLSTAASANSIAWFDNHLKSNPQLGEVLQISMTKSWSENPTLKAPASGEGPILFEVPGLTNAAGTSLYLLDVQFEANVFPKAKSTTFGQFNISLSSQAA